MRIYSPNSGLIVLSALAGTFVPGGAVLAQTKSADQLQTLIEMQQKQIEQQQRLIQEQQRALESLKSDVAAIKDTSRAVPSPGQDQAEVTNAEPRVQLKISGQVNRMINMADDGKSTNAYFVDNQNSTSRFRFAGTAQATPDLTIGSRIEIAVRPNSSNSVSQTSEDSGDSFDQRIVEAYAESKTFGRLLLGKGPTAADGAHEVDLSGTDVIAYASISDLAGALQFRDAAGNLSGVTIGTGFTDFDGSRRDRIRYDSPTFGGFSVSAAGISDQRWDTALFWTGQNDTFKAAGAVAYQDPNLAGVNNRYGGSFSVLHKPTGLNFTTSAGADDRDGQNPSNLYFKAGLIQEFFPIGPTAFSIDYTDSSHAVINSTTRADGESIGLYAVQKVTDYGVDIYGGYRWLSLGDFEDINIFSAGTRVKF